MLGVGSWTEKDSPGREEENRSHGPSTRRSAMTNQVYETGREDAEVDENSGAQCLKQRS